MKNLLLIACIITFSLTQDFSQLGFDPKTEEVDYVKHLFGKPEIYSEEDLAKFKKEHSNDVFLDLTNSVFFDNNDVGSVFSEGSYIFNVFHPKCLC